MRCSSIRAAAPWESVLMLFARHLARARINWVFGIAVLLSAASVVDCSGDRIVQPADDGDVIPLDDSYFSDALGKPIPVEFDTYESSRQVVHPSVVTFPSAWNGHRTWLALTPYPNSDTRVENPSRYATESDASRRVPSGGTNPAGTPTRGNLSDPGRSYEPEPN